MTVSTKKSFRFKLIVWITIVSVFVFSLIFSACIYFSYQQVKQDVASNVFSRLDYVRRALDKGLSCTEVSSDNAINTLISPVIPKTKDEDYTKMKEFLNANKEVCGIVFGYNPLVTANGKGRAAYVRRVSGREYICRDLADIKEYWKAEWYAVPAKTGKPHWAKPFLESNGNLITSYNTPMYDKDSLCYGVLAVDMDLSMIADSLININLNPFPNAKLFIVDEDGRYVAHPDKSCIFHSYIDEDIKDDVLSGKSYYTKYRGQKQDMYVFYTPEPKTGWTIYMEIPSKDMSKNTDQMLLTLLIDGLIGLLLICFVCNFVIVRLTKPLQEFSAAAQQISHGNFNVDLPVIKDRNELYDLRQSLACMKMSLDEYVDKLAETSKKEARMENELNIARGIQTSMVPKIFPPQLDCRNMDVYAFMDPAQAVGGDLYDFAIFGDYMYFCIGDVSGKGVPASLFMAITRSLFRNLASEMKTPRQIAMSLNDSICESNEQNMFVTMFIGRCELTTGMMEVCCCGHNHPVVSNTQKTILFGDAPTNVPIGVIEGYQYESMSRQIDPGTILLLYTDGITEAEDKLQNQFGEKRMLDSVVKALGSNEISARAILTSLLEDVHAFTAGSEQNDDITAICLIYKG